MKANGQVPRVPTLRGEEFPAFLAQEHASWARLIAPAAQKRDNWTHEHRHPEDVGLAGYLSRAM